MVKNYSESRTRDKINFPSLFHGSSIGYVKTIEGKLHFEPQKGYMQ